MQIRQELLETIREIAKERQISTTWIMWKYKLSYEMASKIMEQIRSENG